MRGVSGRRLLGTIGTLVGTLLTICVAYGVYLHVHSGLGAESFQNGYGQYSSWAAYAAELVVAPIILLGIFLVGWWQLWRRSRREGIPMKKIRRELERNRDF